MVEDQPPGFRFYPTEEELVSFYLRNKLEGRREDLNRLVDRIIPAVNIYDYNPWDLPRFSEYLCHRDPEQRFFFIPRQENEARGGRPNRLTTAGYWKATGSPGFVYSSNGPIGEKRTMVFYRGRAPNGRKTEWKMNEYKAIEREVPSATPTVRQEFSLCRIYKKSKCLRAFDRRPALGVIIRERRAHQAHHGGDDHPLATTSSRQNVQTAAVVRTSSSSSSSSGERNCQPSHNGDNSNMVAIASNNEPWWDWEELERFFEIR